MTPNSLFASKTNHHSTKPPIGSLFLPTAYCPSYALIFSPHVAHILHRQYHIIGTLVGLHPSHHTQRQTQSVPLWITEEELRVLVEETPNVLRCAVMRNEHSKLENQIIQEHSSSANTNHTTHHERSSLLSSHVLAKRRIYSHMLSKVLRSKAYYTPVQTEYENNTDHPVQTEHEPTTPLDHLSSPLLPTFEYISPQDIQWSPQNDTKYRIFKDLWSRGFFLTGGMKFGVDWLVYDDDPMMLHAKYMAYIVSWDDFMEPQKMNAMMRLAVIVKKTILMAAWDSEQQTVRYMEYRYHSMKKQIDSLLKMGSHQSYEQQDDHRVEIVANANPESKKRKQMHEGDEPKKTEGKQQKKRRLTENESKSIEED
mmetsp:Transcript_2966/g.11337  ORF Transcript_2966/g.11337 Transcript_2966/m.11337 type:complete len:368 (-) Transcript_2966:1138-2241(-)